MLGDASTWDSAALVSGLLQLVNILRGARSAGDKIQQLEHPIVPVLMLKAVDMAPTASHTVCTSVCVLAGFPSHFHSSFHMKFILQVVY